MDESSVLRVEVIHGRLPTISLSGQADYNNREQIVEAFERLLGDHQVCILVDLGGLHYIDSSGISMLIKYANTASQMGGFVELANPGDQVSRVLTLCGAASFFGPGLPQVAQDVDPDPPAVDDGSWHVSQFSLLATPDAASIARNRVADVLGALPLSQSDSQDVSFAVGEALANAIRHGCRCEGNKRISVKCIAGDGKLCISITDPGPGFEPDNIPPPTPGDLVPGGMGVWIMRQLMDEVSFSFEGGTTVQIVKRFGSRSEPVTAAVEESGRMPPRDDELSAGTKA